MGTTTIEGYIKALGETYESLLGQGFFPSTKPWKIFDDDDQFSLNIENGLSLTFHEGTRKLESIFITLIKTTPSTAEYKGLLPRPFVSEMNQSEVHASFGEPMASKGQVKMPKPMGMTGGWDAYRLYPAIHPNAKVVFQYTAALLVNTLVFSLIDKGHD
ncbi:DUF6392 family protein [Pseudomonas capsici]|uniref:DUF6392 family protein n=1 Tax=Pseudomonas capsici TaxID=2810614 RepID=A0ABT3BQP7_9PSED|nr:DUF6392 family protein [Pseudomonas capsici]MBX8607361.1 hypothetical protein [Pseudomonas cichorii]MBN6712532.1 hypothetical protein [Pseudomonas capsici]MBN6717731.1 hypothetical protein [Pseudomonas capsici]MBN6723218.1 hypothetical protein [Pseudomonas capsici]MCV4267120.1 DUF6392 family protein [Pseudomonas capsici]